VEFVSSRSIKIKDIFLDKGNWLRFFVQNKDTLRLNIITNVGKMMACGTVFFGFFLYICTICGASKRVCLTCKSRFCTSCGKKSTERWIHINNAKIPDATWQHITFTMPSDFWCLFWLNRSLFNDIAPVAPFIIKQYCKQADIPCLPGIFMAIHTFGRDLKRNVHFHLSSTCGGIALANPEWVEIYFKDAILKKRWRYLVIKALKSSYLAGGFKLPFKLRHIKTFTHFEAWLNKFYRKTWMVFLQKQTSNKKQNIDYLGRYITRPPLSEARILSYDGKIVSFEFFDHMTKEKTVKSMSVSTFIGSLIRHIPDKHFRAIRYYGFLSNRTRSQYLPIVNLILENNFHQPQKSISWVELQISEFNHNPLKCDDCQQQMALVDVSFPNKSVCHEALHYKLASQQCVVGSGI